MVRAIDANGHVASANFDAANRLVALSDAVSTTSYTWDGVGQLVSLMDANGHATTYSYDAAHRQSGMQLPMGESWTYRYDSIGNLTDVIDANANQAHNPGLGYTVFAYDDFSRLTGVDYSDATPDVSYRYDAVGNRTSMMDGAGEESYEYDARDR